MSGVALTGREGARSATEPLGGLTRGAAVSVSNEIPYCTIFLESKNTGPKKVQRTGANWLKRLSIQPSI